MKSADILKLLKNNYKVIRADDQDDRFAVLKAIELDGLIRWNYVEFSKDNFKTLYYCFSDKKDRDSIIEKMLEDEKVILD